MWLIFHASISVCMCISLCLPRSSLIFFISLSFIHLVCLFISVYIENVKILSLFINYNSIKHATFCFFLTTLFSVLIYIFLLLLLLLLLFNFDFNCRAGSEANNVVAKLFERIIYLYVYTIQLPSVTLWECNLTMSYPVETGCVC